MNKIEDDLKNPPPNMHFKNEEQIDTSSKKPFNNQNIDQEMNDADENIDFSKMGTLLQQVLEEDERESNFV